MNLAILTKHLQRERYNVLVACRPLAPARTAWNRALQGIIDALKDDANYRTDLGAFLPADEDQLRKSCEMKE